MKRIVAIVAACGLAAALGGCGGAAGVPLDYAARSGRPSVTLERQQIPLTEFLKGEDCPSCVNGEKNVMVTAKVERMAFPEFPAAGREVLCRVESVPAAYDDVQAASNGERTFGWHKEAWIRLAVCDPADDASPRCYELCVPVGEKVLPPKLAEGDRLTLRFLGDGAFFDVKEWSVARAAKAELRPVL